MKYDMKKSGMYIQRLRIRQGYTQEEFAKMLNIDRSYLSRIESGKKGCSVDLLVQLSELLNVSIDYLVTGEVRTPLLETADREQLKNAIENLITHMKVFKSSL